MAPAGRHQIKAFQKARKRKSGSKSQSCIPHAIFPARRGNSAGKKQDRRAKAGDGYHGETAPPPYRFGIPRK
jgi:hypothetical protein